jgi:hypothetical protein
LDAAVSALENQSWRSTNCASLFQGQPTHTNDTRNALEHVCWVHDLGKHRRVLHGDWNIVSCYVNQQALRMSQQPLVNDSVAESIRQQARWLWSCLPCDALVTQTLVVPDPTRHYFAPLLQSMPRWNLQSVKKNTYFFFVVFF